MKKITRVMSEGITRRGKLCSGVCESSGGLDFVLFTRSQIEWC